MASDLGISPLYNQSF